MNENPSDINDYYIIGDLHSAALVSNDASIDWLCLPHFDSPSIFAKLIDPHGGSFSLDTTDYSVQTQYVKDTAIVEYLFENHDSSFMLHDFMVPQPTSECDTHFLIRKFKGIKGKSHIVLYFSPKANYGRDIFQKDPTLEKLIPKMQSSFDITPAVVLKTEKEVLILYLPRDSYITYRDVRYEIHLNIPEGQTHSIVMEYASSVQQAVINNRGFEAETKTFWNEWVAKGIFIDFCRDEVVRSAITLKLMQFYPTGALVASPTTSLPEVIGGVRNWDYRYVWIRDATFTLYAFYVLGYVDEAEKIFDFIQNIIKQCTEESFDVSLIYTIEGKSVPNEQVLEYLEGYKGSKPVRIGNGANEQFQLDVYGALIDAYYFVSKRNIDKKKIDKKLIMNLVYKIRDSWQKKDSGIWEVRSVEQHFTYSKVMAWVGADRALRMAGILNLSQAEKRECQTLSDTIHTWIWQNCYDKEKQTFLQYPDSPLQDATNFLFVLLQFLDKHDPKTRVIIEKTCEELCVQDIFVYRNLADDGLPRGEGAFLLCIFWLISAFAIIEDVDKAKQLFSLFEQYIADHTLLSEEMDKDTHEYLGNYPQAFSHLGFIMSAYYIDRYMNKKKKT